jgi:hypothetical protein
VKAITLWQPWANLIAIGAKPYEFRGWLPPRSLIGQRIAIHAGARPVRAKEIEAIQRRGASAGIRLATEAAAWLADISFELRAPVLSHVVCTAVLGEPVRADKVMTEFGVPVENDSDRAFAFNWAWPMLDVEALEPPAPARGAQGFWEWTP